MKRETPDRDAVLAFSPPEAHYGMPCMFYKKAGNKRQRPILAQIVSVGGRTVDLMTIGGVTWEGVHHIDDPKSKSPFLAEQGSWDLTDEYRHQQAVTKEVLDRISAMEARIAALESGTNGKHKRQEQARKSVEIEPVASDNTATEDTPKIDTVPKINELRKICRDAGIPIDKTWKKERLLEAYRKIQAGEQVEVTPDGEPAMKSFETSAEDLK